MKKLLIATAVIELGAGLALAALPSVSVRFLLGSPLETPVGLTMGRVAGVALVTLGVTCWLTLRDAHSQATIGLVAALLFYNIAVATVLVAARFEFDLQGVGLWPGAGLHLAMTVWCVVCLRNRSAKRD